MQTETHDKFFLSRRWSFGMLFLFVVAGLAGNYLKYPIFLNIDFLFGSIFAMLTLQFLGLGRGILAAALIACYTYVLWNHPYAIVIMTVEVAAVGWLTKHRKLGLVLADTLYWLFIGMPLVLAFYYGVMRLPISTAYMTMTKQAMNGIANALVARLIFTACALRWRLELVSYREIVYNMLALFVLCPVLFLLAFQSRSDFSETDSQIRAKLTQDCRRMADIAGTWVVNRRTSVVNLAQMASSRSPKELQPHLEQACKADANFLRIGLLDEGATITAYYPLLDELGQRNIGKNFADRPFIPELKRSLRPMLSEVVMGRVGTPKPMVTILAPVLRHGAYAGYVTGILSLEQIRKHLAMTMGEAGLFYTLLDKNGAVIMTNRDDQTIMKPFTRSTGTYHQLSEGISQWIPAVPTNTSISDRWQKSYYVAETTVGDLAEWKLILEQQVAPFQKTLYSRYADQLTRLFLILLGALALAKVFSRRAISTLEMLGRATRDMPVKLAAGEAMLALPESRIQETDQLIHNFQAMAVSLSEQYQEVRQINESLERRVDERTKELHTESTRLQALLATASDGIHVLDLSGNLVLCSPSFAQMLGYTMEEAAAGLNVTAWDINTPPRELLEQIRSHIGDPKIFETRHRRKDGSILEVEINARGLDLNGQQLVYNSARDITERKHAEAALAAAKVQAEEANRAKSEFLANMSHEIRTPLAGVIGTTRLLTQTKLNREQRHLAEMAEESGRVLLDVVNDILDFSKIEAGQLSLRPVPFDLRRSLEAVAAPYRLLTRERGLHMDVSVDPATPDAVVGDEGRLGQVLRNLLGNALKFTERGGIALSVAPEPEASSGSPLLRFSVSDTGIGIDPAYLPRIFDSFSQANSTYSKSHAGTGLGLSISKSLVEQMGGSIRVSSQPGASSTFSFTVRLGLPGAEVSAALPGGPSDAPGCARPKEVSGLTPLRVLLADDNAIGRTLIEYLLRAAGHVVVSVGDGQSVLHLLAEQSFDVVLMDIQMPGMDGLCATRHIRQGKAGEKNARMALVALTAYASKEEHLRFLEVGLDEAVSKPAEEAALFAAMGSALKKANARGKASPASTPSDKAAKLPRFDQEYLSRNYAARPDLLAKLLEQFTSASLPELESDLRQALASGECQLAERVAHRARGSLLALGAVRAANLAQEAESIARAGGDARAEVEALLAELGALKGLLDSGVAWGQEPEEG